jgi:hypothetical protein
VRELSGQRCGPSCCLIVEQVTKRSVRLWRHAC